MNEQVIRAVYDRVTGLPIEKAQIRCSKNSCESATDGKFQIEKDAISIQISKTGYCQRQLTDISGKNAIYLMPEAPYAYVAKEGHVSGEIIELRVHCAKPYQVSLIDFKGHHIPATVTKWPACIQDVRDDSILLSGLDWKVTSRIELPQGLKSDIYFISVTTDGWPAHFVPIVVEPRSGESYPMIIAANTLTWHANNLFGGESKYHNVLQASTTNSHALQSPVLKFKIGLKRLFGGAVNSTQTILSPRQFNTNRPLLNAGNQPVRQFGPYQSHLIRAELNLFQWLNENGYRYAVVSDVNLAKESLDISGLYALVLNTHCKYYLEQLSECISSRNIHQILNFGGNALHTKVAIGDNGLVSEVAFVDSSSSLGSELFQTRFEVSSYGKRSAYHIKNSDHQIFKGIEGDLFGIVSQLSSMKSNGGISSERLDLGLTGFRYELSGDGCAGWESDRIISSKSKEIVVAQASMNGGGDMVAYSQNETKVFSASSVAFTSGILVDSDISMLVKNVLHWCGIHPEQNNLQYND